MNRGWAPVSTTTAWWCWVSARRGADKPEVWQFNQSTTEPTAQYDAHVLGRTREEPYTHVQRRRGEGEDEDVNGDRVADLGRLREGTLEMPATTHPRPGGGRDDFSLRPTPEAVTASPQGVQRDSNADGRFDANDVNGLQPLNNTFKIHRGSVGNTDSAAARPSAARITTLSSMPCAATPAKPAGSTCSPRPVLASSLCRVCSRAQTRRQPWETRCRATDTRHQRSSWHPLHRRTSAPVNCRAIRSCKISSRPWIAAVPRGT